LPPPELLASLTYRHLMVWLPEPLMRYDLRCQAFPHRTKKFWPLRLGSCGAYQPSAVISIPQSRGGVSFSSAGERDFQVILYHDCLELLYDGSICRAGLVGDIEVLQDRPVLQRDVEKSPARLASGRFGKVQPHGVRSRPLEGALDAVGRPGRDPADVLIEGIDR
jgi:hypothetical protein